MADKGAREQLLDLLDKKAFDPVLNASPEDYSDKQRPKLKDVQGATKSMKKRYHESYETAEEVQTNFKRDLHSEAAKDVQKELKELGLPTLQDVKGEFEKLADKLGV